MQALFLKKNTKSLHHSFTIKEAKVPHMYNLWHFHQEIEINLVLKGSGTRFVGNNIENFLDEDLVLVGSNLPHVWKNDPEFFNGNSPLYAHVISLHFQQEVFAKELLSLPEFNMINELLNKSSRGIRFYGKTYKAVASKMVKIVKMTGFERLMELLFVLDTLSKSEEFYFLSNEGFIKETNQLQIDKINKVYHYTLSNFTGPITLEEVASVANMNPSAFCRFFKHVMQKTFIRFLTEVRVGYACKLLIEKDNLNIITICYESGFTNLSNFNRQFKEFTGKTPSEYKKEYRLKLNQ